MSPTYPRPLGPRRGSARWRPLILVEESRQDSGMGESGHVRALTKGLRNVGLHPKRKVGGPLQANAPAGDVLSISKLSERPKESGRCRDAQSTRAP
jgi:hypothetical protein